MNGLRYMHPDKIVLVHRKSAATLSGLRELAECGSLAELCKRSRGTASTLDPAANFATRSTKTTRPVMPAREQMFTHRDGGDRRWKLRGKKL